MENIVDDLIANDGFGDPDGANMQPRIMSMMMGVVMKRDDPIGAGRIIARVDGLYEQGTEWLYPLTQSGGKANRGKFDPPRLGAVVTLWFPLGRTDSRGFYMAGGWGNSSQVPTGAVVEQDTTRAVEEDEQWLIARDDRSGKGEYSITHKTAGVSLSLKEDGAVALNGTTITLDSAGAIASGKLGTGAAESILRGDKVVAYLEVMRAYMIVLQLAINAIVPGAVPSPPAIVPLDLKSTKWRVE